MVRKFAPILRRDAAKLNQVCRTQVPDMKIKSGRFRDFLSELCGRSPRPQRQKKPVYGRTHSSAPERSELKASKLENSKLEPRNANPEPRAPNPEPRTPNP